MLVIGKESRKQSSGNLRGVSYDGEFTCRNIWFIVYEREVLIHSSLNKTEFLDKWFDQGFYSRKKDQYGSLRRQRCLVWKTCFLFVFIWLLQI